jgi:hypothetical protein
MTLERTGETLPESVLRGSQQAFNGNHEYIRLKFARKLLLAAQRTG